MTKRLKRNYFELLTYENYEVKTASNGLKTIELLNIDWTDLIISDDDAVMDSFHELVKKML
jgi:DNA-binding NtrC family response regulator